MTAAERLQPYRPGQDGPFGPAEAAHLLRRLHLGDRPAVRDALVPLGPAGAVAELLRPADEDVDWRATLEVLAALAGGGDLGLARADWLTRLLRSPRPFDEVLALFWHGHFATAVSKVERVDLMVGQLETFRRLGRGPLGPLLQAVSRDPAMILWLDGNSNRRHHPNENYARELLELFTLGVGHYDERDVLEAARAFTGWHQRGGRFRYERAEHDPGEKQVLGRRGPLDGDDVIAACLDQPACGRHLAGALYRFFVAPDPDEALLTALGQRYTDLGHHTGAFLAELFVSRAFYEPAARRSLVRSPVALAVGLVRGLGLSVDARELGERLAGLGQGLFDPPSVNGWDPGLAWLNAATLIGRLGLARELARHGGPLGVRLPGRGLSLPAVVDALLEDGLPLQARQLLSDATSPPAQVLGAALSLPEVQLA